MVNNYTNQALGSSSKVIPSHAFNEAAFWKKVEVLCFAHVCAAEYEPHSTNMRELNS